MQFIKRIFTPQIVTVLLVIIAITFRFAMTVDCPLNGDEVGVGVLQAAGNAAYYQDNIPQDIVDISFFQNLLKDTPGNRVADVIISLRDRGMHPPLYYICLHYIYKMFGNSVFVLRGFSILISLLCLPLAYQIGKKVANSNVGFFFMAFMAISGYCVKYSVLVRPYQAAMLFSLLTTFFLLKIFDNISYKNKYFYLYVIAAAAGLYNLYHFMFVLLAQGSICIFHLLHRRKFYRVTHWFVLFSAFVAVAVLFTPWVPILKKQMHVVNSGSWYFNANLSYFDIFIRSLRELLVQFLPGALPDIIKSILTIIIFIIIIAGFIRLLKFNVNIALLPPVYIILYSFVDNIFEMNTLIFNKFHFFLIPLYILFLAAGTNALINNKLFRFSLVILVGLMLINCVGAVYSSRIFDGPDIRPAVKCIVENHSAGDSLIVTNSPLRRSVFPLAHALEGKVSHIDLLIADNDKNCIADHDIKKYDKVFLLYSNVNIRKDSDLSNYITLLKSKLRPGYLNKHVYKDDMYSFYVFQYTQ